MPFQHQPRCWSYLCRRATKLKTGCKWSIDPLRCSDGVLTCSRGSADSDLGESTATLSGYNSTGGHFDGTDVGDVVYGLIVYLDASDSCVFAEGHARDLRRRPRTEVLHPRLVALDEPARAGEVEPLSDREPDKVVAHLHDRVGVRGDDERERDKDKGEKAAGHCAVRKRGRRRMREARKWRRSLNGCSADEAFCESRWGFIWRRLRRPSLSTYLTVQVKKVVETNWRGGQVFGFGVEGWPGKNPKAGPPASQRASTDK